MKSLYQQIAKQYDSIYCWKNYENDVRILESFFNKHRIKVNDILDVACGTGSHDRLLAEKGYKITGIDVANEMLSIARSKVRNGIFQKCDMKNFDLKQRFDAVICLFSSINYNLDLIELKKTLGNFYSHLRPNGICIFDIWLLKNKFRKRLYTLEPIDDESDIIPFGYSKSDDSERTSNSIYLIRKKDKSEFCINSVGFFSPFEVLTVMRTVGFSSSRNVFPLEKIYDRSTAKAVELNFFVGIKDGHVKVH